MSVSLQSQTSSVSVWRTAWQQYQPEYSKTVNHKWTMSQLPDEVQVCGVQIWMILTCTRCVGTSCTEPLEMPKTIQDQGYSTRITIWTPINCGMACMLQWVTKRSQAVSLATAHHSPTSSNTLSSFQTGQCNKITWTNSLGCPCTHGLCHTHLISLPKSFCGSHFPYKDHYHPGAKKKQSSITWWLP